MLHADNGRLVDSYDRPVSQYGASFGSGSDAQASLPQFTLTLSQEVSQSVSQAGSLHAILHFGGSVSLKFENFQVLA